MYIYVSIDCPDRNSCNMYADLLESLSIHFQLGAREKMTIQN